MAVGDWPIEAREHDAAARGSSAGVGSDPRAVLRQARGLLRQMDDATSRLGDAFVAVGLPPGDWRTPEAVLNGLAGQLPEATVDALLTHLAQFANHTGPAWLAGDGGELDDFEREARTLGDVVRPLCALAQSQRMTPVGERGGFALDRALGDIRVGAELDRLAQALRDLADLAPLLVPLPPGSSAEEAIAAVAAAPAPDLVAAAIHAPRFDPWTGKLARRLSDESTVAPSTRADGLGAAGQAYTPDGISIEDSGDPDAPTFLMNGELPDARPDAPTVPFEPSSRPRPRQVLGQRPRTWIALLITAAALLIGSALATLAATHVSVSLPGAVPAAQSTAEARSRLARAATATRIALRSTPTLAPPTPTPIVAAQLSVAPTSVTLSCARAPTLLTVRNTGGHVLTWQASAPGNVLLFPSQGTLAIGAAVTVQAQATGPQHGSRAIVFSSNGGTVDVSYKVVCR